MPKESLKHEKLYMESFQTHWLNRFLESYVHIKSRSRIEVLEKPRKKRNISSTKTTKKHDAWSSTSTSNTRRIHLFPLPTLYPKKLAPNPHSQAPRSIILQFSRNRFNNGFGGVVCTLEANVPLRELPLPPPFPSFAALSTRSCEGATWKSHKSEQLQAVFVRDQGG